MWSIQLEVPDTHVPSPSSSQDVDDRCFCGKAYNPKKWVPPHPSSLHLIPSLSECISNVLNVLVIIIFVVFKSVREKRGNWHLLSCVKDVKWRKRLNCTVYARLLMMIPSEYPLPPPPPLLDVPPSDSTLDVMRVKDGIIQRVSI